MKKSILLRRMIILVLSAILLSGTMSVIIYSFVTQKVYSEMKAKELLPIARTISGLIANAQQGNAMNGDSTVLLDKDNRDFGATLHVYDTNGESILGSPMQPAGPVLRRDTNEEASAIPKGSLKSVLSGSEVSKSEKLTDGTSVLVVGVPIKADDSIIGAVFLTKPMSELNAATRVLKMTLGLSTVVAFLIMLVPVYFATRRMVVPIRRMRDVAYAMSKGDFTVRADEKKARRKGKAHPVLEDEIGELARSMNHFAEESGKLEQTRRDYVANVSHELRTPIASIRAMGETLRDGMAKTDEKKALFYNNVVRESIRLSRLVDDLLELSRLQAGTEAIQKTNFDLREILQNVADIYGHLAIDAKLDFSLNSDMSNPIIAFSNPDRIEQVLIALMDNAVKYTPEGGEVKIDCAYTEATDANEKSENKVEVSITNTSAEISADDLPHIFERFYKADKSHSGGGTGLGLSIAKEIMSALDEKITATSENGKTVFRISIERA